jgi:hypothetical protein
MNDLLFSDYGIEVRRRSECERGALLECQNPGGISFCGQSTAVITHEKVLVACVLASNQRPLTGRAHLG